MKELSIEEKARKYNEALKVAVAAHKDRDKHLKATLERIFPELKESEDEKIRKGIKSILEHYKESGEIVCPYPFISIDAALAWLEKQGNQEETLCDKCKKEQPSHSCQDITALGRCAIKKQGEQKPAVDFRAKGWFVSSRYKETAWSKEDEKMVLGIEQVMTCASFLNIVPDKIQKVKDWLKSLKDRVQPKQGWSDEDWNYIADLISYFDGSSLQHDTPDVISWLKSLKDRYAWKPSEEQLDALQYVYRNFNPLPSDKLGWNSLKTLELMYHDLKKLREE